MGHTNGRFLYALKERGVPGFYWGLLGAGAFCSLLFLSQVSGVWIWVVGATIDGVVLGGLITVWWREWRSYADLPAEKISREWRIFPFTFAGLGCLLVGALTLLTLLSQPPDDYWAIFGALIFLGNYGLAGALIGSLGCITVQRFWSWWGARKPESQPRPSQGERSPRASLIPPRLYERLYGWRGRIAIAAAVVVFLLVGGGLWFFSGGPAGERLPTPTVTATAQPKATETARPSPTRPPTTVIPTPPPTATATMVLVMPSPPQLATTTATATLTRTRTATPQPTSTPSLCVEGRYTVVAGDGWLAISRKLGVTVEQLMKLNPGVVSFTPGQKINCR